MNLKAIFSSKNSHFFLIGIFSLLVVFYSNYSNENPEYFASLKINQEHEELFYLARNDSKSNFAVITGLDFSDSQLYEMSDRSHALNEVRLRMNSFNFYVNYLDKDFLELKDKYLVESNNSIFSSIFNRNKEVDQELKSSNQKNFIEFWESLKVRVNRSNFLEIYSIGQNKEFASKKIFLLVNSYNSYVRDENFQEAETINDSIKLELNSNTLNYESQSFLNNLSLLNIKTSLIESSIDNNYLKFVIKPEIVNWKEFSVARNFLFNFVIVFSISLLIYNISRIIKEIH